MKPLIAVAIGLLVAFVFYLLLAAGSKGPRRAANTLLERLAAEDAAGAYDVMSPRYREAHTRTQFEQALARLGDMKANKGAVYVRERDFGGAQTLDGVVTLADGASRPLLIAVSKTGEAWFVDSITVAGIPLT